MDKRSSNLRIERVFMCVVVMGDLGAVFIIPLLFKRVGAINVVSQTIFATLAISSIVWKILINEHILYFPVVKIIRR